MPARVLIIDDNVSLAENLRDVLSGALEVEVSIAADGQAGLALARRERFDVAIVDLRLPDANGVDLIQPLRATNPLGEMILVTGFATVDSAIAALRAGAFAFILKSFRPEELISNVSQALEKIQFRRTSEQYERRYRAIVEAADVLIVGLDGEGSIILWNPKLAAFTGIAEEAAHGRLFATLAIDEADQKRFSTAFAAARDGDAASDCEVGVRVRMGAVRRVQLHLSGGRGPGKRADLVYGIGIDVTERRQLERRAADAEALNAMAPLALGLAHEIRNPLNAAVLELNLLSRAIGRLPDATAREPMKRRVGIIGSEISRLERMLTDFLELARPRAPLKEPVDLSRVVSDVLELEQEAIAKSRVSLTSAIEPNVITRGDVEKLKQVVLNLVVNALDAMPEGGSLHAEVGQSQDEVWVLIADSGPGIDRNILAEIFDPFFTTKAAGTGLGLAIVRKIVDQHAGRIHIDGSGEPGARVQIILPRRRAASLPPPPTKAH